MAVNRVGRVYGVHRKHDLLAFVAGPFIELPLGHERHALAVPAGRAVIRQGKFLGLVKPGFS